MIDSKHNGPGSYQLSNVFSRRVSWEANKVFWRLGRGGALGGGERGGLSAVKVGGSGAWRFSGVSLVPTLTKSFMLLENSRSCTGEMSKDEGECDGVRDTADGVRDTSSWMDSSVVSSPVGSVVLSTAPSS